MSPGTLLAGIALYNVVQNTLLTERGYVAGNIAVTAGALAWARRSGVDWADLGLDPKDMGRGLATGAAVSAMATGIAWASRDAILTRSLLGDERIQNLRRDEVWRRILIRFPLGTALFEEVVFRGVMPVAFRGPKWRKEVISASAFAAWHIIPTWRTLAASVRGRSLSPEGKIAVVVGGSAAAGVAGVAFAGLRRSASSLAAPWLAHTLLNSLALLLATRFAGLDESPSSGPGGAHVVRCGV